MCVCVGVIEGASSPHLVLRHNVGSIYLCVFALSLLEPATFLKTRTFLVIWIANAD